MRKLVFLLFLLFTKTLFAQNIDFNKVDEKLLSELIFKKINEKRDSLKANPLKINKKALKDAAVCQSEYMVKVGKISHGQTVPIYKDPQTRIVAFGGKFSMSAENVAFIGPDPNKPLTYDDLASQFVNGWVKSPGHFKNLSNQNLQESSVSVVYDKAKKRFFATQVFGTPEMELSNSYKVPSDSYGLKSPGQEYFKVCETFISYEQNAPQEVGYSVYEQNNEVYLVMNDEVWFQKLFLNSKDGIAVDIVQRNQFMCGANNKNASGLYRGVLLEPMYREDILKNAKKDDHQNIWVKLGTLPKDISANNCEYNLLIINNKNVCRNTVFYDVANDAWNLLPMPLMSDFPALKNPEDTWLNKKMNFTIPFEKNKYDYKKEDLKPLHDSLNMTDYAITKIKILAYSSVEGSASVNADLQKKRAESIVAALQGYQKEQITQEVSVAENWVEFFRDIEGSPFAKFKNLSKEDIKDQLADMKDNVALEKLLSAHRKGILIIELTKRTNYGNDPEMMAKEFDKLLASKKLDDAIALQAYFYAQVGNQIFPKEALNKLHIPEKLEYGTLLNNEQVFFYETLKEDAKKVLESFQKLKVLKPKDLKINYNITLLQIRELLSDQKRIDGESVRKSIVALKELGVEEIKVKRLMLNYQLIMAEKMMFQRRYDENDKALKAIYTMYKPLMLTQKDFLDMSKFFANYRKFEWAAQLLADKVNKIDVDEDLLFYYINLTLFDTKVTSQPAFRTILINAANLNKKRFCRMFGRIRSEEGAISFQLLSDAYLKNSYCENCE